MKKLIVFIIIVFGFIIGFGIVIPEEGKHSYRITAITGKVKVKKNVEYYEKKKKKRHQLASDWMWAVSNQTLKPNDIIKTGKSSTCDLQLESGMIIRVKSNSLLTLKPDEQNEEIVDVILGYGKVLGRVLTKGLISKKINKERMRIKSQTAIAGIRGTTFFVSFNIKTENSTIGVLKGKVSVKSGLKAGQFDLVIVADNQKTVISEKTTTPTIWDLSLAEKEELEEMLDLETDTPWIQTLIERINFRGFTRIYDLVLKIHNKNLMQNLATEITYIAFKGGKTELPKSLSNLNLKKESQIDAWKTQFFYKRINEKQALLLSAGPDKTYYTRDDMVRLVE